MALGRPGLRVAVEERLGEPARVHAFQAEVTRFANLADEHKLPERMGD